MQGKCSFPYDDLEQIENLRESSAVRRTPLARHNAPLSIQLCHLTTVLSYKVSIYSPFKALFMLLTAQNLPHIEQLSSCSGDRMIIMVPFNQYFSLAKRNFNINQSLLPLLLSFPVFGASLKDARKIGGLRGLYLYYCYKLGILPKKRQPNYARLHYLLKDDLIKMDAMPSCYAVGAKCPPPHQLSYTWNDTLNTAHGKNYIPEDNPVSSHKRHSGLFPKNVLLNPLHESQSTTLLNALLLSLPLCHAQPLCIMV